MGRITLYQQQVVAVSTCGSTDQALIVDSDKPARSSAEQKESCASCSSETFALLGAALPHPLS